MALWKPIAKNEIRIRTSLFRKNRVLALIIIYLVITRRKRPEFDEGVGEPVSLRGKDIRTLLSEFFHRDKGKVTGEPGRPFDEEV